MTLSPYDPDLGELNRICSTQFLRSLGKWGLNPWYANRGSSEDSCGVALFVRYDGRHACLRILPNAPRYFQSSLRGGLISNWDADLLSRRLLDFYVSVLPTYAGYFTEELRSGRISQIIQQAQDLGDYSLNEAHNNLLPDEIYAALPWPCLSDKHFSHSAVLPATLDKATFQAAARQPLRALGIAADIVCLGPSTGLSVSTILKMLDALENPENPETPGELHTDDNTRILKVIIPSLLHGFQGLTIGIFTNLRKDREQSVLNQLQQFGETVAQKCASLRQRDGLEAIQNASNLDEVARGVLSMIPPSASLLVTSGVERIGYRLRVEENYWGGYQRQHFDEAAATPPDATEECFKITAGGRRIHIAIGALADFDGLDPVLTRLRLRSGFAQVIPSLARTEDLEPLGRSELVAIQSSLRHQITDERGAQSACKALYLVDLVLQHYEIGETFLYNEGCRKFMAKGLARPASGYQVTGKAARKYIADIDKIIPKRLVFKILTGTTLSVRWQPVKGHPN